jgi:predicted MPP superfamily phosphohydrolase
MKRIVIGDPHGRWNFVKQIYDKEQPEEVIILGDYFDSFNIDVYAQRESYEHIIELRKEHLKKYHRGFVMLIGNHDMHYMDENFINDQYLEAEILRIDKTEPCKIVLMEYINKENDEVRFVLGDEVTAIDEEKSEIYVNDASIADYRKNLLEGKIIYG